MSFVFRRSTIKSQRSTITLHWSTIVLRWCINDKSLYLVDYKLLFIVWMLIPFLIYWVVCR